MALIRHEMMGEVRVILVNLGRETVRIRRGDRIAQIVFCPVTRVEFSPQESIGETRRGSGGFGSTGI